MPELLAQTIIGLSLAVLALLLPFAAHRTYLLLLSRRPPPEMPHTWKGPLPRVTVQLPLYNEAPVARRVIDAACSLDYPARALEIQVLDDSTDETVDLVARRVAWWRARGVNVCHIRRRQRSGFKAGALAAGVRRAHGEFLLVLDSDFVPEPDLVRKLLPPFQVPRVGWCRPAGIISTKTSTGSPARKASSSTDISSSSTEDATGGASSSTSTAPRACGGASAWRTRADGRRTRSPRISTSATARRCTAGASSSSRTSGFRRSSRTRPAPSKSSSGGGHRGASRRRASCSPNCCAVPGRSP